MKIDYVVGKNLFTEIPYETTSVKVITHVVNSVGAWGAGFVVPLARKWLKTKESYRNWYNGSYDVVNHKKFELGNNQWIEVVPPSENGPIYVVNMLAQEGIGGDSKGTPPIRYEALEKCIADVANHIEHMENLVEDGEVEIHAPKFGSGLAGGDWNLIEPMILKYWTKPTKVVIYSL